MIMSAVSGHGSVRRCVVERRSVWLAAVVAFGCMGIARGGDSSPVLQFARQSAEGRPVRAVVCNDGSDAYRFTVAADGGIDVESGSERGVLYAVYDVLAGKTSGDCKPAFSIRGLFPCGTEQRHTPEMLRRLIDRMGHWRMNALRVITQHGYREHAALIEEECAERGIEVVHYTYCQLAFCDGIPRRCFAVDRDGKPRPPGDRLETEDRLWPVIPRRWRRFGRESPLPGRASRPPPAHLRHARRAQRLPVRKVQTVGAGGPGHDFLQHFHGRERRPEVAEGVHCILPALPIAGRQDVAAEDGRDHVRHVWPRSAGSVARS